MMARVRVVLAPSGPGCRHVHIKDASDRLLDVMTRDDWAALDDSDPPLQQRIKHVIRRHRQLNPAATPADIKLAIEAEEFA